MPRNHKGPYKEEIGWIRVREGEMTEARGWRDGRKSPRAKEGRPTPQAGKGKETHPPLKPQEGTQPYRRGDFRLPDCKRINLGCFKPPNLWSVLQHQ